MTDAPPVRRRGGTLYVPTAAVNEQQVQNEDKEVKPVVRTPSLRFTVGSSELKGRRPTMEDASVVHGSFGGNADYDLFCVFDGHGSRHSAAYCAEHLPDKLLAKLKEGHSPDIALQLTFAQVAEELVPSSKNNGTTAAVALILRSTLWVANVGDSRVVLCRGKTGVKFHREQEKTKKLKLEVEKNEKEEKVNKEREKAEKEENERVEKEKEEKVIEAEREREKSNTVKQQEGSEEDTKSHEDPRVYGSDSNSDSNVDVGWDDSDDNSDSNVEIEEEEREGEKDKDKEESGGKEEKKEEPKENGKGVCERKEEKESGEKENIVKEQQKESEDVEEKESTKDVKLLADYVYSDDSNSDSNVDVGWGKSEEEEGEGGEKEKSEGKDEEKGKDEENETHSPTDDVQDKSLPSSSSSSTSSSSSSSSSIPVPLPRDSSPIDPDLCSNSDSDIVFSSSEEPDEEEEEEHIPEYMAVRLTYDHRPDSVEEQERIFGLGGFIINGRVNGQLAVTRALGDSLLTPYVSHVPYITQTEILEDDEFLVIACDGLFDVFPDDVVVTIARGEKDPVKASEKLTRQAYSAGSQDNISAVVVRLLKS